MRKRFMENEGFGFEEHQILEMLLYYSYSRGDTNIAAHNLIDAFGGLRQVLDAPYSELVKVKGIGEKSAFLLKFSQKLVSAYLEPSKKRPVILSDSATVGEYLIPKYIGEQAEVAYILCVDGKRKLISCSEISRGTVNSTSISVRKTVETALSKNAVGVIIAHNHPSGVALPSYEDTVATKDIQKALALVDVTLLDHVIVSDDDYISMSDSGLL